MATPAVVVTSVVCLAQRAVRTMVVEVRHVALLHE